MHELLLFGQLPLDRHDQVLKILAGVAGMQPRRTIERHLVFKTKRSPASRSTQFGASQGIQDKQTQALQGQLQGDMFFMQLIREVDEEWVTKGHEPSEKDGALKEDTNGVKGAAEFEGRSEDGGFKDDAAPSNARRWTMRFNDLPEVAGRRPVTSRMISEVDVTEGDPLVFMDAFGYDFVSEYVLEGHRFIHNDIILYVHRVLSLPSDPASGGSTASQAPTNGARATPVKVLPSYESLSLVDPSQAYVLQASIRIQDGNKPEVMTLGVSELKTFRDSMKGVVQLEVGDRLALDTRLR